MNRLLILVLASSFLIAVGAQAQTPSEEQVKSLIEQIKTTHRVLWPDGGEAELKNKLAIDPDLQFVWETIHHDADKMLAEPVVKRELIGRRLLDKSRLALKRLMYLGITYRMTGDRRYADRAIAEMRDVAGFSDWHPAHFLDVAEMTAGMGIGLDWCRDAMNPQDIAAVRQAIIEKGINPAFATEQGWMRGPTNWNQVCHCGLTLGALAISDAEPDVAAKVIVSAVDGLPYQMKNYAPQGAYPEGPGYWGYGTTYNVMGISAMQSALGTDFGLSNQPGFLATGSYMLHVFGPAGLYFNYSDCGRQTRPAPTPAKFYFARASHDDSLVYPDRQWIGAMRKSGKRNTIPDDSYWPLLLIWAGNTKEQVPASLTYVGEGETPVAMFRTGWDRNATYVGLKGGSASTSHAHMDAGTFVVDALGQRWVDSLGMQEYESLERLKVDLWNSKQDGQRWQVFREGPMSQNVLTVAGQLQRVTGNATIVKSTDDRAVMDLGSVYEGQLASVRRGIWLEPGGAVQLRDEVTAGDSAATVRFAFLTRAQVQLDPDGATLSLNGKKLKVTVAGLDKLHMETYSTVGPQLFDAPNPGTQMLGFKVEMPAGKSAGWNVDFAPEGKSAAAPLGELSSW